MKDISLILKLKAFEFRDIHFKILETFIIKFWNILSLFDTVIFLLELIQNDNWRVILNILMDNYLKIITLNYFE
jgi:hypothetical protein